MTSLPISMRAAQYKTASSGLEKTIQVNQAPVPTILGDDHTLVRVAYSSLNPVDYKVAETIGHYVFRKPATPGLDFSGTVIKTNRKDLALGERVFGNTTPAAFGALAEYLVVGKGVVALPNGASLNQAACVGVAGLTAYQSIVPYAPRKIFINGGSGGTGTFGIQIAKNIGSYVVTSCSTDNIQLCKDLGADEVIDYRTQDLISELRKHQFDLIVDNVFSSADIYWHSHEFLNPNGRYLTVGGAISVSILWNFMKVFLIPGFLGGGKRPFTFFSLDVKQEELAAIGGWMAEGKVRAVIDEAFDLIDIGKAFAKLKRGRTKGKIVINIG